MAGKAKGNCPRCGVRMKLKRRYCTNCGNGNPLLVHAVPRRRPASASASKAAGSGYAPVVPLRQQVPPRDPRWTAIISDPDPDARQRLFRAYFPSGGDAA